MRTDSRWLIYGLGAILVTLGFIVAYQFVEPEPPDRLVMASGPEGGAYAAFAERYRAILARNGITLEIRPTAGSIANLDLLTDDEAGVDAAIVQGGLGSALPADAGLLSLGGLFLEPLWVFTRLQPTPTRLNELRGRRLAVGPAGSGTQALTRRLLEVNGIDPGNTELLTIGGGDAARALAAGDVDAAFFVNAYGSAIIREVAAIPGVEVMGLSRAAGYAQVFRTIEPATLNAGVLNFAQDRPSSDRPLVAGTASLVVRSDLHPALMDLLLIAAREIHREGDIFSAADRFPSPNGVSFPLAAQAQRFYERGPPFLMRYLPFWAATLADRMAVLLIPLATLLVPLVRLLPPIYTWRIQSRVYRWYGRLADIENRAVNGPPQAAAAARQDLARADAEISRIVVPEAYQYLVYRLRGHLDLVKARVAEVDSPQPRLEQAPGSAAGAGSGR